MDAYEELAELYQALAHPARLRILDVLSRQESCVCHLTAVLGQRQPYVSQQLAALRDAGLVIGRREGTLIYYSLRDARLAAVLALGPSLVASARSRETCCAPALEVPAPGCQCPRCQAAAEDRLVSAGAGAGVSATDG